MKDTGENTDLTTEKGNVHRHRVAGRRQVTLPLVLPLVGPAVGRDPLATGPPPLHPQ